MKRNPASASAAAARHTDLGFSSAELFRPFMLSCSCHHHLCPTEEHGEGVVVAVGEQWAKVNQEAAMATKAEGLRSDEGFEQSHTAEAEAETCLQAPSLSRLLCLRRLEKHSAVLLQIMSNEPRGTGPTCSDVRRRRCSSVTCWPTNKRRVGDVIAK